MASLANNKKANFDYEIRDKYEAGLVLFGHEVKSVKAGQASLKVVLLPLKQKMVVLNFIYLIAKSLPIRTLVFCQAIIN
jgi:SsrA-binding protein